MATSNFGRNFKTLRDEILDKTQQQIADEIGVTQTTIGAWETRNTKPKSPDLIQTICDLYNVTDQDLFGYSDGLYAKVHGLTDDDVAAPLPMMSTAPVLGTIAAGDAHENYGWDTERIPIPEEILAYDPDTFFVRVYGDSMNLTPYRDGCYAAISPKSDVRNGDIAAVKVNDDDITLKSVAFHDDAVFLVPQSSNPKHHRRIIDATDPDAPSFRVLGKAIWPYYPPEF